MKKLLLLGILLPALLVAMPALATDPPQVSLSAQGILDLVVNLTQWFALLVFALAVVFILYAAFLFITAGGAEETVKKAKDVLMYGVIGIIVALIAYGSVPLIRSFF
ncbi:MAG: hypothetical protein AAB824_00715 [Patescibacteria group bacterium]